MRQKLIVGVMLWLTAVAGVTPVVAEPALVAWQPWERAAVRDARQAGRPVFVDIGAAWCEVCRRLDETTLRDPAVVAALADFDLFRLDGDARPEIARRYRVEAYPTLIVLDRAGHEAARAQGFVTSEALLAMLAEVGAEALPSCSVEGHVHDARGAPLVAELFVAPDGPATRTSADGAYCLRGLAPGSYQLVVTAGAQGAQRETLTVADGSGGPLHHDVMLVPNPAETVVVTGTRTAKLLRESAIRTEVVGRERIEQSAARTLADAVESTPGLRVESNCQSCNFSQVRMLGLGGAYSQILIDGQAQWSPLAMIYGIEQIPTRMIESLEIVKGGGSTLYGPGAIGGVINVRPREPVRSGGTVEWRNEWMQGPRGLLPGHSLNGALDWVAGDGTGWLSLVAQDDAVEPLDLSGDGVTEITARTMQAWSLRGRRELLDGAGALTVDLGWNDAERRGGDRLDLPPDQANLAEWIATERRSAALRWEHTARPAFDYHVAAAWVSTRRDSYYGAGMDPDAYGATDNPLLLFETQLNHRTGEHTVSWGAQVNTDDLRDEQPAIGRRLDATYTNVGLFAQDDWNLTPTSSLVYGVRVDKHSEIAAPILAPRAAFRWAPAKDLTLRTSLSTGFRPPAVFDEDLHIELAGGSPRSVILDPDLTEEKSVSFMQGVDWMPRRGAAFWLVEANVFYTGLRDVFEEEQIADQVFIKTNAGRAEVYGAELGLGFDLPHLVTVELGWVTQRSRFAAPEGDFDSRDFFRSPDDYGVLNVTWRDLRLGEFYTALRYTGPMRVPHYLFDPESGAPAGQALVTSETFLTVDLSWSRRFRLGAGAWALRLMLGARNLTDAYQADIDQGIYRDAGFVYGPRFPRSFYLTTRFDF